MIIDLILLAFFALIILIYALRGFAKSVWGIIRVGASVVAAFLFGGIVGSWLKDIFIHSAISSATREALVPMVSRLNDSFDLSDLFARLPAEFSGLLERCGADLSGLSETFGKLTSATEEEFNQLSERIAEPLADTVSKCAGYVLTFLIVSILLSIIWVVVDGITKLPVVKSVNRFLGALFGAAAGLIYLWIICLVLGLISESSAAGETLETLRSQASSSVIVQFFCAISPFDFVNITGLF